MKDDEVDTTEEGYIEANYMFSSRQKLQLSNLKIDFCSASSLTTFYFCILTSFDKLSAVDNCCCLMLML